MSQPLLGIVATAIVVAVSLAFVALFDFASFAGEVSFVLLCMIPAQIVIAVIWGARLPFGTAVPRQPVHGLTLMAINVVAGALIAPIVLRLAGEGISPPGPIPSHFAIIVVPTTFWLAIMMGGWPFTATIKNRGAAGLALLVASYAITAIVFRVFFNYDFLKDAPVYLASAPHGLYNAVTVLVFYVTCLAAMFLVLCFDLWPLTRWPAAMAQPRLGILWTLLALGGGAAAMFVGVGIMGVDPMIFLTRVTAPFIFGTIIVLNMLQGSLFARAAQPLKGLLNAALAIAAGAGLAWVYRQLAPVVTGPLASGPPGYDLEVWLANALLSVTFPFLIFFAVFFGYWPIARQPKVGSQAAERAPA